VNYWLDLFTGATWQEFLDSGAKISGFREGRWTTVQKIAKGDVLLCYLTGVSRFIGVLEVTSQPYRDSTKIWSDEDFPCRLKVKLPTFSRLSPPLASICRYIAFNTPRERISAVASVVKYLKPEFLEELSEDCEIDDA